MYQQQINFILSLDIDISIDLFISGPPTVARQQQASQTWRRKSWLHPCSSAVLLVNVATFSHER